MRILRIYNILALLLCFFGSEVLLAQNNCGTATQFCTGTLDPFPAVTGQQSTQYPSDNNNYDCLYTQPNRTWYTMTMANAGDVRFTLNNSAGIDIDFIVWGPFPNAAAANAACGNLGNGGVYGEVADCSYSAVAIEPVEINNVQAGEVYIMLVTNYNGGATNIYTQNNTGTADFLCDCDLDANFAVSSFAPNDGFLVSTDTALNAATYLVCAPVTPSGLNTNLAISITMQANNISDTLSVFASGTTVDQAFPGSFQLLPLQTSNNSIEVIVWIQVGYQHIGEHEFFVSILSKSVDGTSCVQRMPIRVIIPGVEILALDTTLCPAVAHNVVMDSRIITAGLASGTGTYSWVQTAGPLTTTITGETTVSPTISIPSNTVNGQVFSYALTYVDPTGCVTSDSISIRMIDRPIDISLTADKTFLCNNGEEQVVNLNIEVEENPYIVVSNGSFSWNTTQYLTNETTANPIATLTGFSSADSFTYILNYAYGTCIGSDTLTLNFYDVAINATPERDTLCVGQQLQLAVSLTDSIKVERLDCTTYNVENIPFSRVTLAGATPSGLSLNTDSDYSRNPISIGFPFNFYCNNYENIYASTDGFISFNALTSSHLSNTAIPAAGNPNNIIAFAWDDLVHTSSSYQTLGTAPNRYFGYEYTGYRWNTSSNIVNVQVILYETTNIIEMHVTSINPNNVTSNTMTQGIENATGTAGTAVTGRNNTSFSTANSAVRFYPRTVIDYAPVTFAWNVTDILSSNNTAIATPTGMVIGDGTIYVDVTNGNCLYRDSVVILSEPVLPAPVIACGTATNNSVQFTWDAIPGAVIYEYTTDGGNTWIGVVDPQVTIGGLMGGSTVEVQVRGVANTGLCALGLPASFSCTALDCDVRVTPVITHKNGCITDENIINNGQIVFDVIGSNTNLEYNFGGLVGTSNTFSNLDAGTYVITITKAGDNACSIVQTVTIEDQTQDVRLNANVAGINSDTVSVFVDNTVVLDAGFNTPGTTYSWSGPLTLDPSTGNYGSFLAETEGDYLFEVTATAGACTNTDRIVVRIQDFGFTGMPTAFTPNGDGENDVYRPVGLYGAEFKVFKIYNRWGHKVFETTNMNDGWDGKVNGTDQPRDIYVYYIEFKLPNEANARELRGEFTLLR